MKSTRYDCSSCKYRIECIIEEETIYFCLRERDEMIKSIIRLKEEQERKHEIYKQK